MTRNLRSEQNENNDTKVKAAIEYVPEISIPLGVVRDWTPVVLIRDIIINSAAQPDIEEKNLQHMNGVSISPPNFLFGDQEEIDLPSIMDGTTYEELENNIVKINFCNVEGSTCSVKYDEVYDKLRFGFWNSNWFTNDELEDNTYILSIVDGTVEGLAPRFLSNLDIGNLKLNYYRL